MVQVNFVIGSTRLTNLFILKAYSIPCSSSFLLPPSWSLLPRLPFPPTLSFLLRLLFLLFNPRGIDAALFHDAQSGLPSFCMLLLLLLMLNKDPFQYATPVRILRNPQESPETLEKSWQRKPRTSFFSRESRRVRSLQPSNSNVWLQRSHQSGH